MNPNSTNRIISECFVKPQHSLQESKHPFHLTSWDVAHIHPRFIIQRGLVFPKHTPSNQPQKNDEYFMKTLLDKLKNSLSLALLHFYPLAGRLAIVKNENNPSPYSFHVDCTNPPGAKFVHAAANLTISDILSPVDYVPAHVIQSFFEDDDMTMDDLHTMSLLSVRVTELVDGMVVACCMSHGIADGNSFCHFFNMLSEIFITGNSNISRPPILQRWFPDGHGPTINLSSTVLSSKKSSSSSYLLDSSSPEPKVKIFQISSEAIAKLKAKANAEYSSSSSTETNSKLKISSFQSLSALVWRSITRARNLPPDQTIACFFPVNNRVKLEPPLSEDYFGNSVSVVSVVTSAGELLENGHGWAAWKLHQTLANYNDKAIREEVDEWFKSPEIRYPSDPSNIELNNLMAMNDCLKFNMYGIEFGLGKAQGIVHGRNTAISGYVRAFPGRDYDQVGNIDLEVCLWPHIMSKLEADEEFMEALY